MLPILAITAPALDALTVFAIRKLAIVRRFVLMKLAEWFFESTF
jgi:hypothetical protein